MCVVVVIAPLSSSPLQVMLSLAPSDQAVGVTSLSGNLSRAKQESKTFSTDSDHLENIGMMIEAMENTLRSDMDGERGWYDSRARQEEGRGKR